MWNAHYLRSLLFNYNALACRRLIRRAFALDELPSLIEAMLSNEREAKSILCLPAEDAQILIDVINEARSLSPRSYEPVG